MYAVIDLLADKLDRQIIKYKDKHLNPKNKGESIRFDDEPQGENQDEQ